MIISHKLKFAFLANPKCGSTTVQTMVARHIGGENLFIIKKKMSEVDFTHHHYNHVAARHLKQYFDTNGYDWNDYFTVATVRNPWDRMVSVYENSLRNYPGARPSGFDQFLDDFFENDARRIELFAYDEAGNRLVTRMMKMETLDTDLPEILSFLKPGFNIEEVEKLNAAPSRANYQSYYTPHSRQRVAEIFKYDIENMGYVF